MPKVSFIKEFVQKQDKLPEEETFLRRFRDAFGSPAEFYGFKKVFPSLIEDASLAQSLNKNGCLFGKNPLVVKIQAGKEMLLSPPLFASLLRYFSAHEFDTLFPVKLMSEREVFFKTGSREHWFGTEYEWVVMMAGEKSPVAEAEMIQVVRKGLEALGIWGENIEFRINAMGCDSCQPLFRSALLTYLRPRKAQLCRRCRMDLSVNPLAVFECSDSRCSLLSTDAPQALDYLCDMCKKHLRGVLEFLEEADVPYFLDSRFFQKDLYLNDIVFSFMYRIEQGDNNKSESKERRSYFFDTKNACKKILLATGGRLKRAAKLMTGNSFEAAGVVVYPTAIADLIGKEECTDKGQNSAQVFLIQLGEFAKRRSLAVLEILREGGIEVNELLGKNSLKYQLRVAEKMGVKIGLILGHREALDETIIIRELDSGIQEIVPQKKLLEYLKRRLERM